MSLTLTIQKYSNFAQKWVKHESGAEFLINGIGNKAYNLALEQVADKSRNIDFRNIKDTDESPTELMLEAAGRYLIADWRNIKIGEAGNEQDVQFTKENGALALTNSIPLWSFVMENARKIQAEIDGEKVELMGKSEIQSTGEEQTQPKRRTQSTKRLEKKTE